MKVIAGRVNGDGTVVAGHGFSVTHPTVGTYVISFPKGTWETAITDGLMDLRAAVLTVTACMDVPGTAMYPVVVKGDESGGPGAAEFTVVMFGVGSWADAAAASAPVVAAAPDAIAAGAPVVAGTQLLGQVTGDQGFAFIATQAWPQSETVTGY